MKKLMMALVVIACTSQVACEKVLDNSNSQVEDNFSGGNNIPASQVPATVMSVFTQAWPSASSMQWKLLKDGNYKVEFLSNAVRWQITYSPAGAVLKQERA